MAKLTDLITNIDSDNGNVTIAFPIDNKVQVLAGLPVSDINALGAALEDYQAAYIQGIQAEQVVVDPTLKSKVS